MSLRVVTLRLVADQRGASAIRPLGNNGTASHAPRTNAQVRAPRLLFNRGAAPHESASHRTEPAAGVPLSWGDAVVAVEAVSFRCPQGLLPAPHGQHRSHTTWTTTRVSAHVAQSPEPRAQSPATDATATGHTAVVTTSSRKPRATSATIEPATTRL